MYFRPFSYPRFTYKDHEKILDVLDKELPDKLWKIGYNIDLADEKISDFLFLLGLGVKRNWKWECPICLNNKRPKQDYGKSEMIILRNCGHAFCHEICLDGMLQKNNINILPKTVKIGEMELRAKYSSTGLPYKQDDIRKLKCLICGQTSVNIFNSAYVCLSENDIPREIYTDILQAIEATGTVKLI